MGARVSEPKNEQTERLPARRDPVAEKIAWAMDSMFSVRGISIGLDGIIGLIPGFGDILGAVIGMIIVLRAVQAGVPRVAIARMVTNIAIDTFVGSIPILGDAFDFAYKSNLKNVRIYEAALERGRRDNVRHWGFFTALFGGIAAAMALGTIGLIALIRAISHAL